MVPTHRISGFITVALLAMGTTACTPAPTSTPTSSPTATPSPNPSASTASPEDRALVNAKEAVVTLWAVLDRLTNDPQAPIQDLDPVASGQVLTKFQENLTTYRAQGWRGSGTAIVENPVAVPAKPDAQGRPTWSVTACVDRSHTTLVDKAGKSVQMPPYRISHRSTVVRIADRYEVDQDEATGTC